MRGLFVPRFAHPEDVKADIRKRYGSVAAFERRHGLPALSVRDVLRGKSRAAIARVVAKDLGIKVTELEVFRKGLSHNRDRIKAAAIPHRLSAGAK